MEEEDFSSLPLEEKLLHKSWKARQQAYEELSRKFRTADSPKENIFWDYFDSVKKFTVESNAVAQEAAISCLTAYLECCDASIGKKLRPEITVSAIEKGLSAMKAGTRTKTVELLMILIELDVAEPVVTDLISFLSHKQPKLVASVINCLTEIIKCFGANVSNVKSIIKVISGPFAHADKNVRSEVTALVVEINRWMGPSVLTLLNGLKPVQMKELQDLCAANVPSSCPTPSRYLRSQRPVFVLEEEQCSAMETSDDVVFEDISNSQPSTSQSQPSRPAQMSAPAVMDAYDLADSVDVNTRIPHNFYESLGSPSWKERKEALESVLPLIKVSKIADNSRYGELVDSLCKRVGDVNVVVVVLSVGCLEAMANGLRSNFAPYRNTTLSSLLEKAKEKKQNVVDAIRSALDSLRFCTQNLNESFLEELSPFFAHKNPSVRSESLLWLSRLMQNMPQAPSKKDCKAITDSVIPAMDDGTTEVRESSAVCLACIQKFLGESGAAPFFEKLDKIKLNKVKELSSKIQILGVNGAVAASVPTKAAPTRPVPALPIPAPQPNRKVPAETQLSSQPAYKSRKMDVDDSPASLSFAHSDEEAIRFFNEWFGETLCNEISDSVWKVRLTAMEQIYTKIDEASEIPFGFSTELLVRLFSQKPSWKDSNFQVVGKVISCLIRASKHQFYTRESASLAVSGLAEKLSDPKLRNDCGELFFILAEQVSVGFILFQVSEMARSQKSPKIHADIVKWLQTAVQEFGIDGVKIQDLIALCKTCLGNSNPTVRGVAIGLAGTLRSYVGPDLRLLFNDVSSSILTSLDAEFTRILSEPAPVPSRKTHTRSVLTSSISMSALEAASASSANLVEDLIPRTNITSQINDTLISKLADASWKERKAGLDEVSQILASANNRVKYTSYELFNSLKARLSDSNKNLSLQALEICGALAEAMGSAFDKNLKTILPAVLETLSDNKVQVRQAALKALDRFSKVSPISSFFSCIGPALIPDSPNTRRELLTWASTVLVQQQQGTVNKEELLEIVGSIAGCLQDRSVEVRKSAQSMVSAMLEHSSVDSVKKACSDQQPKLVSTLMPLLEAARKIVPSVPVVAAAPVQVPQAAPRTPQRTMSVRQSRPITPIKPSASLQNLNEEAVKNPMDEFPLLSSEMSGKLARAEKDKGSARWSFDAPRKDIVDFLREQMLGNVSYSLVGKLFSDDFRDNIAAMNRFEEFIQLASDDETKAKYVANLDLILKYLTLRFFDTNTSVLIKALELTEAIVSFMDNCNYRLSEYEATSFLPFLITKMGDGKEVMRTKIHSIFRQVCRIYPASKIFSFFMEGLKSKNSRTRSECLEELAKLLSRNGLSVVQPSRHFPTIGSLISDRDSQVRNAALNVLVQANQLMGPAALQKHLQGLSAKDIDLLDERLKRAAAGIKEPVYVKEENVDMTDAPLPQVIENPVEVAATALSLNLVSLDFTESDFPAPTFRRSFEPSMLSNPLDHALDQIQFSTDLVCIHALQSLETHLNGNEYEEDLKARVNDLTHSLIVRMKEATSTVYDVQEVAQMKSRLCRYVTNALVLITSNTNLCSEFNEDVLELLVSETLSALVSERIRSFEDQEQLEKALNILIVKVLEGVPQNRSYGALLTILREAFRVPPAETNKFPELVMKCLWKLTKQLSVNLQVEGRINVPELLSEVHSFLTVLPPIEWKMRSNESLAFQDLPLRTVKTILHEIVQQEGIKVLDSLTLIPEPEDSFVLSYLKAMLQSRGVSEQEINSRLRPEEYLAMEIDQIESSESNDVDMQIDSHEYQSRELSNEQINMFLRDVCSQICSKPDTRLGLQQLYDFRASHPYALEQINQFLSGLGDFFHKYISRCLERIEIEQIQAATLKKSTFNSGDSGNTVEAYKQKLVQLRQQIFGESPSNAQSSENQPPDSPSALRRANSHMESPKLRSINPNGPGTPTKLSAAMDLATAAAVPQGSPAHAPASPSSILSLKERLARLRDDKSRNEQILNIIEKEFDLELLLKYREMRILEHELERGKELKELLEKLILNEQIYADKSSGRLSALPQFNFSSPTNIFESNEPFYPNGDSEIYGTRTRGGGLSRHTQPLPGPKPVSSAQQYQYDIKPDGTILRMKCPSCGAEKFRSMLGFLNHCRINCKLAFENQEDRLHKCGVPIPSEEIPTEFKNLSHSLIQKSMELAQICVDVQPTKLVEDSTPDIKVMKDEPIELTDFGIQTTSPQIPILSSTADESITENRHSNIKMKRNVSRYYIKKEIIIGNVSRCLLRSGEINDTVGGRPASHYFKLFIRDANFRKRNSSNYIDPEDNGILRHIKFARFFLHSAYKPNDVIDVFEHPFTIERPAWGEFPIRIQLHFFDERNKPVDLVHLLSLYTSTSSRYDQGVERLHEVEMDRNTDFKLGSTFINQSIFPSEILDSESDDSETESINTNETISQSSNVAGSSNQSSGAIEIDPTTLKYCRYCGIPHMPQHSFEIIQKNCAHKPRKIRLNSRTLPSQLFSARNMLAQEYQPVLDIGSDFNEIPVEEEVFVNEESSDLVKMAASSAKLLDLLHFIPSERTSVVIAAATKCFLKHLITKSIEQIPAPGNRAALDQKSPSVLTPLHIFQAVTSEPIKMSNNPDGSLADDFNVFDFLSNAYFSASMGPAKPV